MLVPSLRIRLSIGFFALVFFHLLPWAVGQLAQAFSSFYQKFHVLDEPDAEKKAFLLWMTDYFRMQLERTLGVLGIEVPEYM